MSDEVRAVSMGSGRRRFLAGCATLGAGLLMPSGAGAAIDGPLEVRRLRLVHEPSICMAPQYLAEPLLRAEGFDDVEYVRNTGRANWRLLDEGAADLTMDASAAIVAGLEASRQSLVIAGIHAGCYELFAGDAIPSIRALKGRRIAVSSMGGGAQVFMASILAYIGLDPRRDVVWVPDDREGEALHRFERGQADAFMAFAPQPQDLRAKGVGKVILDTSVDKPWSQYFCCMLMARREFANRYPVATMRALRALLKATDLCASAPQRAARELVNRGFEPRYEVAFEVLSRLPYDRWRTADPEDTLRFHALRLREAGMIRTPPNALVAGAVDWRHLRAVQRGLKS